MTILRPVSSGDGLFLVSVSLLALASLWFRADRGRKGYATAAVGWTLFGAFWATTVVPHLREERLVHAGIVVVTVLVSLYVAVLSATRREPAPRLTLAFTAMGAVFVPFQFVVPVHRTVLTAVTTHAAWTLTQIGFHPQVGLDGGVPTVIYFPRRSLFSRLTVGSACSGISAVALFAGLVAASRQSYRRRIAGVASVTGIIYVLNVIRVTFVAGAIGGAWFAGGAGIAAAMYGVTDPVVASYLLAEHVVSQALVVAVLCCLYLVLLTWFDDLQSLVGGLTDRASEDVDRLLHRRESPWTDR